MHGYIKSWFKDLDVSMENQDDTLVITLKGDKGKIKTVEKKLKAIQELCVDDCNCDDSGCSCC